MNHQMESGITPPTSQDLGLLALGIATSSPKHPLNNAPLVPVNLSGAVDAWPELVPTVCDRHNHRNCPDCPKSADLKIEPKTNAKKPSGRVKLIMSGTTPSAIRLGPTGCGPWDKIPTAVYLPSSEANGVRALWLC